MQGADAKQVKTQIQSLCKFYTQFNKLYLTCCNMWQDHLNAIKKYMNVEAGGTRTVGQTNGQPNILDPKIQVQNNAQPQGNNP